MGFSSEEISQDFLKLLHLKVCLSLSKLNKIMNFLRLRDFFYQFLAILITKAVRERKSTPSRSTISRYQKQNVPKEHYFMKINSLMRSHWEILCFTFYPSERLSCKITFSCWLSSAARTHTHIHIRRKWERKVKFCKCKTLSTTLNTKAYRTFIKGSERRRRSEGNCGFVVRVGEEKEKVFLFRVAFLRDTLLWICVCLYPFIRFVFYDSQESWSWKN